ncbi:MAG: cytochrome P450 [Clostridia bacterium]|nr:cytochrome P450 [Deltaproteobacteria bacterium]
MQAVAIPEVLEGTSLPGPKVDFAFMRRLQRDPMRVMQEMQQKYGDLVHLKMPLGHAYVVAVPGIIEQVLVRDHHAFIKDVLTRELRYVMGVGLLTNEHEPWKRIRKIASPPFTKRAIASYAADMVQITAKYVAHLVPDVACDVHKHLMEMTLEIVVRTVFGANLPPEAAGVGAALDKTMTFFTTVSRSMKRVIPKWLPTPTNIAFKRAVRELDKSVSFIIADKRHKADPEANDLISLLIRARDDQGDGLSDLQLRDEAITMFLAGHETTALVLSYALLALAQHPELQKRALDELDDVLQGRAPTMADTPNLKFLDTVVSETMRLYPPAWVVAREATRTTMLGNYRIEAGAQVWMSQYVMHRDGRFFTNADDFDPDRWSGALKDELPRFVYFPFGGGPRVCIGNHFAMMETMLALATILQKRTFEVAPEHVTKLECSVTLRPALGVKLIPRLR